MYELLWNLVAPDSLNGKWFDDLVKTLHAYLKPKPFVIVEWFNFHKRMQHKKSFWQSIL